MPWEADPLREAQLVRAAAQLLADFPAERVLRFLIWFGSNDSSTDREG